MPTPDELRASHDEARQNFRTALESVTANWERQPEAGEGEEAWSARQAAEHAIGVEVAFAKAVCDACGYPGPERPELSLTTPAEALAAFEEAAQASQGRLKYVSAEELAKPHERLGTVENIMTMAADHLNDHAGQIRAATA